MMNIRSRIVKRLCFTSILCLVSASLWGCVDQSQGKSEESATETSAEISEDTDEVETLLAIDDPEEKAAVEAAKKKVSSMEEEPRIIATSPATADICDKLDLELVGICSSTISTLPDRYDEVETVGTAMSPDMEIVASLDPDWILSPSSLQGDLQPKYEAIDTDWAFLNLRSVPGMYRSIQELGEIFGREEQAQDLVDEFTEFYKEYKEKNEGKVPEGSGADGASRFLYYCDGKFLCWESCGTGGRRECLRRNRSGIPDCQYGGHEDEGAGHYPVCFPCASGSGDGDVQRGF